MEMLQNDIKKYCDGGNETEIKLSERASLIRVDDEILLYHELMLPHWKKFANELNRRASSVTLLRIRGISLPTPVLDIILPAVQSMHSLVKLALSRTGLGKEGYQNLSSFLNENTTLQKLAIIESVVDDLSIASAFSDAVKDHPALERLMFNKCGLNGIPILGKLLDGCGGMTGLGILGDGLGSEAVALIANFIRSHKTIERLRLKHNRISDNDTVLLAAALKMNRNLTQIDLGDNAITEVGEKVLLKAIYDPTSMDSIIESNHTCVPYTINIIINSNNNNGNSKFWNQLPSFEREVMRINWEGISIQQKIRRKVVLALCRQDGELFDLSHFNELPLGVMPRVLELIQNHSATRKEGCNNMPAQLEKDALSRLFHILRGWEIPSLFVNLNTSPTNVTTGKRKRRKTRRY